MSKPASRYLDYHREMRCAVCVDCGLECPLGYYNEIVKCDVCGYRYARCWAACAPTEPGCVRCGHSVEVESQR